ncbi:MAG: outer membrane beta-barrel protein [Saprospiraceae bacterium]
MSTNKLLLFVFFLSFAQFAKAQVSGLSYTVAPAGEYIWWNDQAGLENGFLYGGKLGFGFGEYFEMRASYQRANDLKNSFEDYGIPNFDNNTFTQRDVKLTRWGGEMKANLSRGKLLPYILLGTGVQTLELDGADDTKQIYLTAGAGFNLALTDRITLLLEARNTAYRMNSGSQLLTSGDRASQGVGNSFFEREDLTNWSAGAALQFYLGGRKPGSMSELDKAYFNSISGGARGLDLGLEVVAGRMNFSENLKFRDTYMAGASAGLDFGPYIGLRGFYWRGMEEDSWNKFDELAMYGGEIRMRMNTSGGIVPFLMLGGGMIDVLDDYTVDGSGVGSDTVSIVLNKKTEDTPFAMGGLGLLVPLGKNLKVFGSARAIMTSTPPLEDLYAPEEVNTSWFYSAGIKLRFGKKNKSPQEVYKMEMTQQLDAQRAENDARADKLKLNYEQKVIALEEELMKAYEANDLQKAEIIKQEQAQAEQVVAELEKRDDPNPIIEPIFVSPEPIVAPAPTTVITTPAPAPVATMERQTTEIQTTNNSSVRGSEIRMSPAEFQNLIEEILESVDEPLPPMPYNPNYNPAYNQGAPAPQNYSNTTVLEDRIAKLESQLAQVEEVEVVVEETEEVNTANEEMKTQMIQMEREMSKKDEVIADLNKRIMLLEEALNKAEEEESRGLFGKWKKKRAEKKEKKEGGE